MVQRYALPLRILHWLMAALFIGMLALGLFMTTMPLSPAKLQVYSWHKWIGMSLFFLVLIRIIIRLSLKAPGQLEHMSPLSRRLAKIGHVLLYILMLAAPLSGWLMSSAKGFQTVWFGVIPLPDLIGKNLALGENLVLVHHWVNYLFIAVIAGHVLAALKHHFIDKDPIFKRISLSSAKE
ncbi:cytochrome b [Paenalcaligenes niemegkensis]|uniref:cytochrome b n=1 Tax=Paenalcaligenes niemegkensis TaxID=2895469 RepID=UPI001EE78DBB|nr:cytochrome b [Paenalcaligenes niemegkensis]MCQ9616313.1 cytochrome b [Paenalcaligenes niemegkensis]